MNGLLTHSKIMLKLAVIAMFLIVFAPVITRLQPTIFQQKTLISEQICTTLGLKTINFSFSGINDDLNILKNNNSIDDLHNLTMANCDYCVFLTKITIILAILFLFLILKNISKKQYCYSNLLPKSPYLGKLHCRGPPR